MRTCYDAPLRLVLTTAPAPLVLVKSLVRFNHIKQFFITVGKAVSLSPPPSLPPSHSPSLLYCSLSLALCALCACNYSYAQTGEQDLNNNTLHPRFKNCTSEELSKK